MDRKDAYLKRLEWEGERRATARLEAEAAMAEIAIQARRAHKAGATKTAIAKAAQISRPALDAILKTAKVP